MDIESHALLRLADPREAGLADVVGDAQRVLRVWKYPAFEPYRSWFVYRTRSARTAMNDALVIRLSWDRSGDLRVVPIVTEPRVIGRVGLAPGTFVARLVERATVIPLQLGPLQGPLGLDGTHWGYEHGDASTGVRLTWWCDGPEQWRHFTAWVYECAGALDAVVEGDVGAPEVTP